MKLYVADFGWEGGLAVVAASMEDAFSKMKEKYPDWKFTISDLREKDFGQVVFFRGDS
jgi:hypothetical protein